MVTETWLLGTTTNGMPIGAPSQVPVPWPRSAPIVLSTVSVTKLFDILPASYKIAESGSEACSVIMDAPGGIAGLCSADGRVTILMPHPERVQRTVQHSWHPPGWGDDGPWLRLFRNARVFVGS